MIDKTFDVYFNKAFVGKLCINNAMRMSFTYDDSYIVSGGQGISLTMPATLKHHEDEVVFPFIENLLPEGDIRSLIQSQNKIEEGNFARFVELLGGDVAGALSIQLEGRVPLFEKTDSTTELSRDELSKLLLDIQDHPFNIVTKKTSDANNPVGNRLSLAGAQNKLPIIKVEGNIFEASSAPSTHIIKPARKDNRFKSLVYNEYICMKAAKLAGIDTAEVELLDVYDVNGNESDALLIERYDRVRSQGCIERLQQEDLCQLRSIPSTMKYQVSGGPGYFELFNTIKSYSAVPVKDDVEVFKRLIFNLIIGNYDAHAKNFSFLTADNGAISLSPAYDLVCTALYDELDTTFAMNLGNARSLETLNSDEFKRLFETISKKYLTMNKQLIKYGKSSLEAVSSTVSAFISGNYYQVDIDSAQRILEISEENYDIVLKAL